MIADPFGLLALVLWKEKHNEPYRSLHLGAYLHPLLLWPLHDCEEEPVMDIIPTITLEDMDDETLMLVARAVNTEVNLLARLYQDYPEPDLNERFLEQRKKLTFAYNALNDVVYERRIIRMMEAK